VSVGYLALQRTGRKRSRQAHSQRVARPRGIQDSRLLVSPVSPSGAPTKVPL